MAAIARRQEEQLELAALGNQIHDLMGAATSVDLGQADKPDCLSTACLALDVCLALSTVRPLMSTALWHLSATLLLDLLWDHDEPWPMS